MSRTALITGATGFVGSHLAETLAAERWDLRALVRRTSDTALLARLGAECVVGDLADPDAIRSAASGVDVVFHLAAVTAARDEAGYIRANVDGTRLVAEAVAAADVRPQRLVYLSSYAACGPARNGRPRHSSETPEPLTAYGRTKLEGEEIVRTLEARGIEVVVLRAPAVYGPRDRALLPYFRLVQLGLAPVPSGGERRLHMIYAPDLARALARAADVTAGTYPVAEAVEHTWSAMVDVIAETLGKRPLRVPLPPVLVRSAAAATEVAGKLAGSAVAFNREKAEEMLAPAWICDLSGSAALLSPDEATPLAEGIARTVDWYRTQGWI
jgi:dihydroflavonol-4-reductase